MISEKKTLLSPKKNVSSGLSLNIIVTRGVA